MVATTVSILVLLAFVISFVAITAILMSDDAVTPEPIESEPKDEHRQLTPHLRRDRASRVWARHTVKKHV